MTHVFVMTAAHCVEHYPSVFVETAIVRLGTIYRDHGGQDISVKEVRVHGGKFKFLDRIVVTTYEQRYFSMMCNCVVNVY